MNYNELLNMNYKCRIINIIVLLIIIISCIFILNIETYDVFSTYGIYEDDYLIINIPLEYSDTIQDIGYIKIDENKHYVNDIIMGNIILDNNTNYQEVKLDIDNKLKENSFIKINIYHHKSKIKQKVKKLMFN